MPSQQQLRWAQLRVGLTVVFAAIALAVLILLMSGTTGIFVKKIHLVTYFDNAGGLRVGAPVRLQGVDIGNVSTIRVVPDHEPLSVQVISKISTRYDFNLRKDSQATLSTAGVLGETFVDIDSTLAKGRQVHDWDVLETKEQPELQDVVRASQGTLQNLDALVRRLDRIISFVESGQGSIGKLIYDEALYRRLNSTLNEVQSLVNDVSQGKGSIGKVIVSDELDNKANAALDKLNNIVDQVNSGQGTLGKFVKDPSLYNNANATVNHAQELLAGVNQGKGAAGRFFRDEEFARKLDNTVTKLNSLANRLDSGEGTLGRLFSDPSLYTNTDQMVSETRNLIKAIRENPKKYLVIRFRVF